MFEGNTFLPVTGMPIRKIACMMRPLAEADPVPLAVAILNAKSLTRSTITPQPRRHDADDEHESSRHCYAVRRDPGTRRPVVVPSSYIAANAGIDTTSPASGM